MKDWKETLLMPETGFDMKANLAEKEPQYRSFWKEKDIYNKSLQLNKKNKQFVLHDGPPYANGNLHVGHALNKILKDVIVRRKHLEGFYSPFILGWDTHGLPIENKMLEQLKTTQNEMDPILLRKEAAKYAASQIVNQKGQFELMSLFTDMNVYYETFHKAYETEQLKLFSKMVLDGLVYKGLKPVYWSPSSQSALAEAEVEYQDHTSPRVIVRFLVTEGNDKVKKGDYLLIMTTTPWTLIANSGVAFGGDISYSLVENEKGERFVIASKLVQSVMELAKFENYKVVDEFEGGDLFGLQYQRPVKREKFGQTVLGHHVSDEEGTGLVHMAPLFGEDDFIIGRKNRLEMIMHVDDKGNFNSEAGEYEGLFYADANKNIGQMLESHGDLLSIKFVKHSYPHDWRTHKPVIFRGVPQWFVSIDQIKDKIQDALKDVKSHPEWAVERMSKMIDGRGDWTISRQRTWGVPIIIFYDNNVPVIEKEIFDYVIDLVSQHGTDIWWEKSADELLPPKYRGKGFTKEMNIMDVWFDSGSSSVVLNELGKDLGISAPFDIYFEGSDQYRGWFNSSLINAVAYTGKSPYKELISHGFVLDEKMQKMSKSKGNVVDPLEIIKKQGSEILRLWAANTSYSEDVTISDKIINQTIDIYRWIRNSIKNIMGNLKGFDCEKNLVKKFDGEHELIFERTVNLKAQIDKFYADYDFINIVKTINVFLTEISGLYIEAHKDTLYCDGENWKNRRMVQSNLFNIISVILPALAPILPVTIDEAYSYFNIPNKKESIFLERSFMFEDAKESNKVEDKFKSFFVLKDEVFRKIEELKKNGTIKKSGEVVLTLNNIDDFTKSLNLVKLFIVGKIEFGTELKVEKIVDSVKCQRCWNHFDADQLNDETICKRCAHVVNGGKDENY